MVTPKPLPLTIVRAPARADEGLRPLLRDHEAQMNAMLARIRERPSWLERALQRALVAVRRRRIHRQRRLRSMHVSFAALLLAAILASPAPAEIDWRCERDVCELSNAEETPYTPVETFGALDLRLSEVTSLAGTASEVLVTMPQATDLTYLRIHNEEALRRELGGRALFEVPGKLRLSYEGEQLVVEVLDRRQVRVRTRRRSGR